MSTVILREFNSMYTQDTILATRIYMLAGTLKGFDQTINLILDESHERVFSSSQGVEQVVLGLYIVRGDNVAVIGEIDEETDSALDLGNIRAEPLNSVAH
uniref:U6 snRNA-associated Sm-like protein LSm8 n=1 Tax=Peromyscus maniculatus bairdii TaxID=230844 RepID=A0A8C9CRU0_PERMB